MSRVNAIRPSPEDPRDWTYEGVALVAAPLTLPATLDLRPKLGPVRDQGWRGTCAAFTACCIKEYHETIDHEEYSGYMSPDSVYFYRSNKPEEGMYCRDVMKILSKRGSAREQFAPYSQSEPASLSAEAVKDAKRFKIKNYAQVRTVDGAKKALLKSGPLLIAFPYYENGQAEFWRPSGSLGGGHAVACVGWTEKGFIIRNSWGSDWNGDGHVVWPFDEFGMHWEIWSAVDKLTRWTKPKPKPRKRRRIRPRRYIPYRRGGLFG